MYKLLESCWRAYRKHNFSYNISKYLLTLFTLTVQSHIFFASFSVKDKEEKNNNNLSYYVSSKIATK